MSGFIYAYGNPEDDRVRAEAAAQSGTAYERWKSTLTAEQADNITKIIKGAPYMKPGAAAALGVANVPQNSEAFQLAADAAITKYMQESSSKLPAKKKGIARWTHDIASGVKTVTRVATTALAAPYEEMVGALRYLAPDKDQYGNDDGDRPSFWSAKSQGLMAMGELMSGKTTDLGDGFFAGTNTEVAQKQQRLARETASVWRDTDGDGVPEAHAATLGRLAASGLGMADSGSGAFNIVSGIIDMASNLVLDPANLAGDWVSDGIKAGRYIDAIHGEGALGKAEAFAARTIQEASGDWRINNALGRAVGAPEALNKLATTIGDHLKNGLLIDKSYTKVVHPDNIEAFWASKTGGKIVNVLTEMKSPFQIRQLTKGKVPTKLAVQLAKIEDPAEMASVLREATRSHKIEEVIPTRRGLSDRIVNPEISETGGEFKTGKVYGRFTAMLPGKEVNWYDPDMAIEHIDRWQRTLGMNPVERQKANDMMMEAFADPNPVSAGQKAFYAFTDHLLGEEGVIAKHIMRETDKRIFGTVIKGRSTAENVAARVAAGSASDARRLAQRETVHENLKSVLRVFKDEHDKSLQYFNQTTQRMIRDGTLDTTGLSPDQIEQLMGPTLASEMLRRPMPLPDVDAIRQLAKTGGPLHDILNTKWGKAGSLPVTIPKEVINFYTKKIWNPLTLLRPALTVRQVLGDDQVRMGLSGYDSLFHHPGSALTWVISEKNPTRVQKFIEKLSGGAIAPKGDRDILGQVINTADKGASTYHDDTTATIIDWYREAVTPGISTKYAEEHIRSRTPEAFSPGHAEYVNKLADKIQTLAAAPLESAIARGYVNENDIRRLKAILGSRDPKALDGIDFTIRYAGQPGAGLDAIKQEFWDGALKPWRDVLASGGKGLLVGDEAGASAHVDQAMQLVSQVSHDHPDILEAIGSRGVARFTEAELAAQKTTHINNEIKRVSAVQDGLRKRAQELEDAAVERGERAKKNNEYFAAEVFDKDGKPDMNVVKRYSPQSSWEAHQKANKTEAKRLAKLREQDAETQKKALALHRRAKNGEAITDQEATELIDRHLSLQKTITKIEEDAAKRTERLIARAGERRKKGLDAADVNMNKSLAHIDNADRLRAQVDTVNPRPWEPPNYETHSLLDATVDPLTGKFDNKGQKMLQQRLHQINAQQPFSNTITGFIDSTKKAMDSSRLDDFTGMMFESLLGKPSAKLSRSSVFKQAYWAHVEKILPGLTEEARAAVFAQAQKANLGKATLERMKLVAARGDASRATLGPEAADMVAKQHALKETQSLLYDLHDRSQFGKMLAAVVPFADAWRDGLKFYASEIAQNPQKLYRMGKTYQAARGHMIQTDPNTGEDYVLIPGSTQMMKHLAGVPFGMRMSTKGANIITASMLPGGTPALQIAANKILQTQPAQNLVGHDLARSILRTLSPYGDPLAKGIISQAAPPWMEKLATGLTGWQTGDRDKAWIDTVSQTMDYLYSHNQAAYGNLDLESQQRLFVDATTSASKLFSIRGLAQAFAPSPPTFDSMIETSTGELKVAAQLSKEFFAAQQYFQNDDDPSTSSDTAFTWFIQKYGTGAGLLTVGRSRSDRGIQASREWDSWAYKNSDLATKYPEVFGYLGPGSDQGEYDYQIAAEQMAKGQRQIVQPKDRLLNLNDRIGDSIYRGLANQFDENDIMGKRGAKTSKGERAVLKGVKTELTGDLEGYNQYKPTGSPIAKQIQDLYRLAEEPSVSGTRAGEALQKYLATRSRALAVLKEGGYNSFQSEAAQQIAAQLSQYGENLAAEYPEFQRMWRGVLAAEL